MSGIAGIVHFTGAPVEPGQLESLTTLMRPRGPDGIHHWRHQNAALGHCMLHSTPESLQEQQPCTGTHSGQVLVMDGRLDNWLELRQELLGRGAQLRNRSDAELALHAFELWGTEALTHLDGDFALALWDPAQQTLLCARDRFGNRPLYYHWNGQTLAFASELKPLLQLPWVPQEPDEDTIAEHLGMQWHSLQHTLWRGILRAVPATRLQFSPRGAAQPATYWTPEPTPTTECRTPQAFAHLYRHVLGDSVRRMSRSHRPIAYEVSGGLDSSALYALALDLQRQGQLLAPQLAGYTLDFTGDAEADEVAHAQAVGQFWGQTVEAIPPFQPPLAWYLQQAQSRQDLSEFPNGTMGRLISRHAHTQGARVIISGTGGDEWAGGSPTFRADLLAQARWRAYGQAFQQDALEQGLPAALWLHLRHGLAPLLPTPLYRALQHLNRRLRGTPGVNWLTPALHHRLRQRLKQPNGQPLLPGTRRPSHQRLTEALWEPYWQMAKLLAERQMAHDGLEWRQPFWSRPVVELAFALPAELAMQGRTNKWLHRQALADLLPPQVLHRQDKACFDSTFTQLWPAVTQAYAHSSPLQHNPWLEPQAQARLLAGTHESRQIWQEGPPWLLLNLRAALGQNVEES